MSYAAGVKTAFEKLAISEWKRRAMAGEPMRTTANALKLDADNVRAFQEIAREPPGYYRSKDPIFLGIKERFQTANLPKTPRQRRIAELSGKAHARAASASTVDKVKAQHLGFTGQFTPATEKSGPVGMSKSTPMQRRARSRNLDTGYRYGEGPGRMELAADATHATVHHEMGEKEVVDRAMSSRNVMQGSNRDIRRLNGALPYDSHGGPFAQMREMASRPSLGPGQNYGQSEAGMTLRHRTPAEQFIAKKLREFRISPAGDFPVGGKHQTRLHDAMAQEFIRHPKKYKDDLQKGFRAGVSGLPLHPTLEEHYMQNWDRYEPALRDDIALKARHRADFARQVAERAAGRGPRAPTPAPPASAPGLGGWLRSLFRRRVR